VILLSLFLMGCAVTRTPVGNEPVGNETHFQVHAGVGLSLFVTDHIFIRPQFDIHYVPSLTQQFNSNLVTAGMVWVGYNFGDR